MKIVEMLGKVDAVRVDGGEMLTSWEIDEKKVILGKCRLPADGELTLAEDETYLCKDESGKECRIAPFFIRPASPKEIENDLPDVLVVVSGGVGAYYCKKGMEVEIVDFDNLNELVEFGELKSHEVKEDEERVNRIVALLAH